MSASTVVYDDDHRYPGPPAHPPPSYITGIPTQGELDAQARMFTWGELKEIVQSGDLELLMRNKKMQSRYDEWMTGMKTKYGSTEKYLTQARLPWAPPPSATSPTYDLHLDPRTHSPSGSRDHLDLPPSPSSPKDPGFNAYPHPPLNKQGEPSPNARNPDEDHALEVSALSLNDSDADPSPQPTGTGTGDKTPQKQQQQLSVKPPVSSTRHTRTPSITISPSVTTPPKFPLLPEATTATPGSGASTPSSVGFVSLSSLNLVNGKLRRSRPSTPQPSGTGGAEGQAANSDADAEGEGDGEDPVYLRWEGWLDGEKYAVLPNDWPYNIPYGVRHFCVWSRIPIAHPDLVDYDPEAWSKIESEGLGGFTGVTPLFRRPKPPRSLLASDGSPDLAPSGVTTPAAGRAKSLGKLSKDEWYAVDVDCSGPEKKRWAGKTYECRGGQEVGRMVRGLWDERGWECLWFVNPPRLQSVPGFSHFHVFARRKTPEEIDAAESAMAAAAPGAAGAGGGTGSSPSQAL